MNTSRKLVGIAVTTALVLASINGLNKVYGQEEMNKSYILTQDCEGLTWLIENSVLADPYREYVGEYEIVCAPFVKDVSQTRQYVELLRQAEPTANLVFVYDIKTEMQQLDLQRFFVSEAGWAPLYGRGYANEEAGYAVSVFEAEGPLHELTHLVLGEGKHCGASNDPSVWGKC